MPTWAAEGKLGGGKTLWAMSKVREYLAKGVPVAVNFDVFPEKLFRAWRDETEIKLMRIPDSPKRRDLVRLGVGNPSNDESRNGLIVVDECAGILNARDYQDGERKKLINYFKNTRKLGWDVIFIIQSVEAIDKQVRNSFIEYRTSCRRLDRLSVPGLASIGIKIHLPRVHFATSRYGLDKHSPVADRDWYKGNDLFQAYNTKQTLFEYSQDQDDFVEGISEDSMYEGTACMLPPWHLKGRYMGRLQMLTQYARGAVLAGVIVGASAAYSLMTAAGYERSKPLLPVAQSAVKDVIGVVGEEGGWRQVILKDGDGFRTREMVVTREGAFFRSPDGRLHVQEGAK